MEKRLYFMLASKVRYLSNLELFFQVNPFNSRHQSKSSGLPDVVAMLLQRTNDLTLKSKNGETVLHYAARRGDAQVLKTLLKTDRKWDLSIKGKEGNTVRDLLELQKMPNLVLLLNGKF